MTKEKHPRFNLTFRDLGGSGSTRSVDMKLVATDYDDFALLWGCSEPNLFERKGDSITARPNSATIFYCAM